MRTIRHISLFILILTMYGKTHAQATDTVCNHTLKRVYKVIPTPGSTYFWSVDCGTIVSSNINADSIVVDWCQVPGTYQIKVRERSKNGCWGDTVRTWVIVSGKMHLEINGPSEICEGEPVVLQASGAVNYLWNSGETTQSVLKKPSDTTIYRVIGNNVCENDTAYFKVKVDPRPKASFTYQPKNPIVDEAVFFHYTGTGANHWIWYFGDKNALGGEVTDPDYTFNEKGNKVVTLVATNEAGCSDTMTYMLHVTYNSKIFVPNAFTPNDDGDNAVFKAMGYNIKTIHMRIFNRWGEQIFESDNLDGAWDGKYKGEKVIEGVYIYTIEAQAKDGENYYLNGNVTVFY